MVILIKRLGGYFLAAFIALAALVSTEFRATAAEATIDLVGRWSMELDPQDQGVASRWWEKRFADTIKLPGTLAEAGKGDPLTMQPLLPSPPPPNFNPKRGLSFGRAMTNNATLLHFYPRFSYVGPAWYRRTVDIPQSWSGQDAELELERVIWESRLWVNGQFIDARNSLVTPHRYEISSALKPGRNEIVIRVDNRRQREIGNPHAYTGETQTIWNGIIGRIALRAREKIRVDQLRLRPDLARRGVEVSFETHNGGAQTSESDLCLQAAPENFKGASPPELKMTVFCPPATARKRCFIPWAGISNCGLNSIRNCIA